MKTIKIIVALVLVCQIANAQVNKVSTKSKVHAEISVKQDGNG